MSDTILEGNHPRIISAKLEALLREIHIKIFSSETTGPIATNLWWNVPWMAPFQNFVQ
jgi:hypothetical protein